MMREFWWENCIGFSNPIHLVLWRPLVWEFDRWHFISHFLRILYVIIKQIHQAKPANAAMLQLIVGFLVGAVFVSIFSGSGSNYSVRLFIDWSVFFLKRGEDREKEERRALLNKKRARALLFRNEELFGSPFTTFSSVDFKCTIYWRYILPLIP